MPFGAGAIHPIHYWIEVSLQDWPADGCESLECALKLPFAELRLHAQRRRLLGSNYVGLWHFLDLASKEAIGIKPDI